MRELPFSDMRGDLAIALQVIPCQCDDPFRSRLIAACIHVIIYSADGSNILCQGATSMFSGLLQHFSIKKTLS